jgi:hypothetical protein
MSESEYLRVLISQIRAVVADCFDLRASERLRLIADELERRTNAPPFLLDKPSANNEGV